MPHHDRYGLPLSTAAESAATAYREGVDLVLSAWPGAADAFERAIAADPEFALAHIARARVHSFYSQMEPARVKAALARDLVMRHGSERERSHVDTLALAIEGQTAKSLTSALAHLERWPRDAVVMSMPLGAFGLFAFSGMADHDQARADLCGRFAGNYGDDWWFLTYHGWSLTENGDVARGRRLSEQAFGLRRANANAVHGLLHAMFEDGSTEDADALVTTWIPTYERSGILHGHISWHQALGALERGDAARALAIYAAFLQPKATSAPPLNAMSDSASLLWRLQADGHAVPEALWSEAAAHAAQSYPKAGLPFADIHMALFAAATGDQSILQNRLADIEQRVAEGKLAAGRVVPGICRAVYAFAEEDYQGCIGILEPVLGEVVRIGGSHAQREMIEDTLILALIRNGQLTRAHALLDNRLHRRPSQRDLRWRSAVIG